MATLNYHPVAAFSASPISGTTSITVTKSSYVVVNVLKAPIAAFSASSTSGNVPLKVQFTDKSLNNPTSWKWNFGDGTYSTARDPAHTYSKVGKYTVSLTVKNAAGSNAVTKSSYINVVTLKTTYCCFFCVHCLRKSTANGDIL